MSQNQHLICSGNSVAALLIICTGIILRTAYLENKKFYWLLLLVVPLLAMLKSKEKD